MFSQWIPTASATTNDTTYYGRINNPISDNRWISANQSALFNASENAYALKYGTTIKYEDFTTGYVERFNPSVMSQTERKMTWTDYDRTDEMSISYENHPDSSGGKWSGTMLGTFCLTYLEPNSGGSVQSYPYVWVQGANVPDYLYIRDNNLEAYGVRIGSDANQNNTYRMSIWEYQNGVIANDGNYYLDLGTPYYFNITKDGLDYGLKIYNNSDFTDLFLTFSLTLRADHPNVNDFYPVLGYNAIGSRKTSGYVEDVTFGLSAPGYFPIGTIWSENLLTNTTENASKFLMNYTINTDTSLGVDFSSDNSSWVGSQIFDNGLEYCIVDLDPYNLNPLYVRFQLNTTDTSKTPLIHNYEVLYTTDGNGEINLDAWSINWLMAIIWLVIMGIGVFKPDRIIRIFAGFFGLILGLLLMAENGMVSIALICLNLYLVYEGSK